MSELSANMKRHKNTCIKHQLLEKNRLIIEKDRLIDQLYHKIEELEKSRIIHKLPYGSEDWSHISPEFLKTIIETNLEQALILIQRRVFENPKNRNVKLTGITSQCVEVYEGGQEMTSYFKEDFLKQHVIHLCNFIKVRIPETDAWERYQDKLSDETGTHLKTLVKQIQPAFIRKPAF
jgi:hypothetical protein